MSTYLPNAEFAVVDITKLRDYCLNPRHGKGKHKARLFAAILGLTADDAEELREALLMATLTWETIPVEQDEYGQRYTLDFQMMKQGNQATVRSCWIIRPNENVPRLTSC
ncbi:MAG: hypothetical protein HC866_13030 [Leptolyngbyaceae cyanobacterium RU_5_1]|nr:hypothetical protein [Leptolyngbyaceae cyanobacterium RU_5_1]